MCIRSSRNLPIKVIALLLLTVAAVAAGAAAATAELEFSGWEEALIGQILERFNREHPDIRISLVSGNSDQILARMAAGTGPDVYRVSWAEFTPWMRQGLALDLTPYIDRDKEELKLEEIFPGALTPFQMNGRQYAMPHHIGGNLMYINLERLAAAGLALPREDWDWNDFVEVARRTTLDRENDGRIDVWGFVNPNGWQFWIGHIESNGTRVFDGDVPAFNFNNQGTRDMVQFVYDLVRVHGAAPGPGERPDPLQAWRGGNAGMVMSPATAQWSDVPFERAVLPNPTGTARRVMPGGPQPLAINPATEHPEEAWTFLKWINRHDIQAWISIDLKLFPPTRRTVVPLIDDPILRVFGMELENQLVYTTMISSQVTLVFTPHLDAVLRNEEAIPAAVEQVQHELSVLAQEALK